LLTTPSFVRHKQGYTTFLLDLQEWSNSELQSSKSRATVGAGLRSGLWCNESGWCATYLPRGQCVYVARAMCVCCEGVLLTCLALATYTHCPRNIHTLPSQHTHTSWQLWVRHAATYMMFNRILGALKECLCLYLHDEWLSPSASLDGLRDFDIQRVLLPPGKVVSLASRSPRLLSSLPHLMM